MISFSTMINFNILLSKKEKHSAINKNIHLSPSSWLPLFVHDHDNIGSDDGWWGQERMSQVHPGRNCSRRQTECRPKSF
jgi:hypothetical protein